MTSYFKTFAGIAVGLLLLTGLSVDSASAQSSQTASSRHDDGGDSATGSYRFGGQEPRVRLCRKTHKERINTIARRDQEHDIKYIDSRDRASWGSFDTWQGIRDRRPMIARKTMGFHAPRPHVPRSERELRISRGPIRGPGFSE